MTDTDIAARIVVFLAGAAVFLPLVILMWAELYSHLRRNRERRR